MFKVFNKKESEVLDLTANKSSKGEIPVPEEIRRKIEKTIAESTQTNVVTVADTETTDAASEIRALNSPSPTTEESKPVSGGGFFNNFFGGSSSPTDEPESTVEETGVESKPISRSNLIKIRDNFQKLSQRISGLTDRIELLEKKIDRIEGR